MKYFNKLLICFVGFALIPSSLLFLAMVSSRHYAETQVFEQSNRAIASGSEKLHAEILEIFTIMESLAASDDISAYLVHPGEAQLVEANRKLYYSTGGKSEYIAAYIISPEQEHGIGTDVIPGIYANPIRYSWGILRMIQETDGIVMRPSEHSRYEGKDTMFSFGRRISTGDRILGFLVVDVKRALLETLYPGMSDATTYLYQGNNLIYNSSDPRNEGLDRLPDVVKTPGIGGIFRHDAGTFSLARAEVPGGVLSVAHIVDMNTIDQAFFYVAIGYLAATAILLIVCPVIAYHVARNVTRPIKDVTNALRKVEGGNLDVRIHLNRSDEIGRMGEGFNEMTARIRELISNVQEKQRELDIAQNRALLAQLNPHFLYNTLDLIKWAAKMNDNATVGKVTVNLARLLRSIVDIEADVIPVRMELEIIRYYIDVQKLRYGTRLEYREDVPERILDKPIPRLLIQPLVENAIEHGIQKKDGAGILVVRGRLEGKHLVFAIVDNGAGFPDKYAVPPSESRPEALKGIGLSNVHRRAQLYGGERCGLTIGKDAGGNTMVSVTVPDGIVPARRKEERRNEIQSGRYRG